jgi:hypothetical protein
LYLTIDATHPAGQTGAGGVFSSLNATLWADPKNDAGAPSVSETSGPTFANGMANDIVLATGTMVSASVSLDPTTMTRSADDVVAMTPTLEGTMLLGASIKSGTLLEVKTTTPPADFETIPQQDGTTIFLVNDGTAQITLDPQGTVLVPNLTHAHLHLSDFPRFIDGNHHGHHGGDRRGR